MDSDSLILCEQSGDVNDLTTIVRSWNSYSGATVSMISRIIIRGG
ncbi:MAG: hypothetical protein ACYS6K_20350 [Planctomycetota bacterium]